MPDPVAVVEAAGHSVEISNPDKVFFDERGETKLDLVHYYEAVAGPLMAAMGDRPVLLQRFPHGASGSSFFQKRVPESRPDWLQTTIVSTPNGTTSQALVAADLAHVLWAVNLGCLGFHVWPHHGLGPRPCRRVADRPRPDTRRHLRMLREAAGEVHVLLDEVGVVGLPKTTGNRGIHVYVRLQPRWTSYEVRAAAVAVARELERRRPELDDGGVVEGGAGPAGLRRLQPERPRTRPSSARGRCGRGRGRRCRPPSGGTSSTRSCPTSSRSPPCRARVRPQGDPWAEMSDDRQSLTPCWRCTSATAPPGSPTRHGRRSTRRCPASRLGWRPAGRARAHRPEPVTAW